MPIFYAAFKDERLATNHWERSSLLNQAMNFVGTQDQANTMFAEMIVNEAVPANLRTYIVLSLYGAHRADTPYSSDLINGRMQLLDNLKRDVKDDRVLRAIDEAQLNLQKLQQPPPKPPPATPGAPAAPSGG